MSLIAEELKKHSSFIIVKPNCPFCVQAKALLKRKNVDCAEIKLSENMKLVDEIVKEKNHMTFPMIFLNGEFIGGCDDLQAHFTAAENKSNLQNK